MTHGSLFSGIGGFDLAAEWMSWENIFHCEWNEFGQKVLKHYWPNAKSYHDITKTDFTIHRGTIDIITGGFPCQPYSSAGKRKGKEDERHLWPQMCRAIREIQPRWVVGENVFGLVNWSKGLVFHEVQTDLEAAGYEVWPYVLPAAAVNAPHRRDRVWFVAYSKSAGNRQQQRTNSKQPNRQFAYNGENGNAPNSNDTRFQKARAEQQTTRFEQYGELDWTTSHPDSNGLNQCNGNDEEQPSKGGFDAFGDADTGNEYGDVADTSNEGLQGRQEIGNPKNRKRQSSKEVKCSRRYQRNDGQWQNFPTQSPVCTGNDGLSPRLDGITFPKWRNESIKAGGNAIVPQVALQIFKAIDQYEQTPA
jgi:DNA (cytosine-5)-methyltransferase 1